MRVGTDAMRTVAAVIWPDEHIVLRKIKIRQLRDDLAKLNQVDPSTVLHPPQPPSGGDLGEHHALMRRREGIFSRLPQSTKDAHPEIYAMSISQMVQSGIVTQALVDNVESAVREWENEEGQSKIKKSRRELFDLTLIASRIEALKLVVIVESAVVIVPPLGHGARVFRHLISGHRHRDVLYTFFKANLKSIALHSG